LGPTPVREARLSSGSYLLVVARPGGVVRYPLVVERARSHRLRIRIPGAIPAGMTLVPGGPFLSQPQVDGSKERVVLPDFAIGTFPVTLGQYAEFLTNLDEPERRARTPLADGRPVLVHDGGSWHLRPDFLEGEGR